MKKLCLVGAAAALLIGASAYGFAQSKDSSQKMSPGHAMHKRGGLPGAFGYAPGHRDEDDRGTLRDRDDRMMNHDRD
jgi:Spy/CpxP family protein refolding chaperone